MIPRGSALLITLQPIDVARAYENAAKSLQTATTGHPSLLMPNSLTAT